MKPLSRILFSFLFLLPFISSAQEVQTEMADTFRSEGKIYIVIAVMAVILTGLFIYLFIIGKKVADIEKKMMGKKDLSRTE